MPVSSSLQVFEEPQPQRCRTALTSQGRLQVPGHKCGPQTLKKSGLPSKPSIRGPSVRLHSSRTRSGEPGTPPRDTDLSGGRDASPATRYPYQHLCEPSAYPAGGAFQAAGWGHCLALPPIRSRRPLCGSRGGQLPPLRVLLTCALESPALPKGWVGLDQ